MKKILIIEDDAFLKDLESTKFNREGFEVLPAGTAEEADQVIAEHLPDIILLDLLLPGTDGFEILKKFRSQERTKNIPIIIFSNLSDDKDVARAKEAGATEFIVKANYTLDEIVKKIKELVG